MSTKVYLFPNAKASMLGLMLEPMMQPFYAWCRQNVGKEGEKWHRDGVTIYSQKIIFEDEQDAIVFRLKFGI